jgi:FkbM family methyltransferase
MFRLPWVRSAAPSPPRATETDVIYAYRLILKREPDAGGLAHYQQLVRQGLTLDHLVRLFEASEEHRLRVDDETRPTAVDLGGYQVLIQMLDMDFGQAIWHTHQYEEHVRQAVRDHLREGEVCVDVGANIGAIAFLAATIVGPAGRVVAVEPNPDNLQLLYRGIALNGFQNVEVFPFAASDRRAVVSLTGGTSNTHLVPSIAPDERGVFAQTVALDDVLGGLSRLDFVKMDIEGHEPLALKGMSRLMDRHRPTLLIEFNPSRLAGLQGQDPDELLRAVFASYPRVRVTTAFGDDETFERAGDVRAFWERRDQEVASLGLLPKGLLHFDLVAPRP